MRVLYVIGICLYWLCWAPLALLKDAASLLMVPFDTQRCINTYVQMIRNAQALTGIGDTPTPQQPQQ